MKKRNQLIALAIIIAAAVIGIRFRPAKAPEPVRSITQSAETAATPRSETASGAVGETTRVPLASTKVAPIDGMKGHGQESVELTMMLMKHTELGLTKSDMEKVLVAYVANGIVRSQYEASIASVKDISEVERVITVPPYPDRGKQIQEDFYRRIGSSLGVARAEQIRNAISSEIYVRNRGYGETEQTISVKLLDQQPVTYVFTLSTGPLHVETPYGKTSIKVTGAESIVPIGDLSSYSGFANLLPKG